MPKQSKEEKKSRAKKKQTLPIMVEALHNSRIALREAEGTLEIETALFNKKNEKKINAVEAAKLAVQLNDETLRLAMVEEFEKTGQIALGPGLDIRQRIMVGCTDPENLKQWALHNATFLMELNWSLVEQISRTHTELFPYVTVKDAPTAYVAKDLSKTVNSYNKA